MSESTRLVDLSHRIVTGMEAYPGLPSPRIEPYISHAASRGNYEGRAEFTITRLFLVGNTGTYLDSPWHRHPAGSDLAGLPLRSVAALDGLCLDGNGAGGRSVSIEAPAEEITGRAVLVRTGWDRRWGDAGYWRPGPYLGSATIDLLVSAGAALVGVDFWNADDPADPERPAHTRLLAAGIPIVEHLTGLDSLPRQGFRFHAAPPAISGAASFPVRAYAELPNPT
jgi:arylformamidase